MSRSAGRPGRGAVARLLGLLAALGLLAGCAASGVAADAGGAVANPGYVSGDGTVTQWDPENRGDPVALAGRTYQGGTVDVAQWRGGVVVVNFWYAACPPCRLEAPDLAALATDYADRGVHLVGVNSTDDAGTALAFERTFAIPYPSIGDTHGEGVAAMQGAVPLRAVPTTVVLDTEGRIAARILGRAEPSTLRALVDDALAGPDA
jgi:thiol-disulfide isomerase/thioredoxin